MKLSGLIFLIMILGTHLVWAQSPVSPTEEELLDFDSIDKGGKSAPPPEVAPGAAVPTTKAQNNGAPPSTSAVAPAPTAAAPPTGVNAADAQALEGPPPGPLPTPVKKIQKAQQNQAAPPVPTVPVPTVPVPTVPVPEIAPPPMPAENTPPAPEMEPPPPEIVNDEPAPAPIPEKEVPPEIKSSASEPPQEAPVEESNGEVSASDRRNESRFARIYEKFNQSEIGDEKWSQIAGEKSSENYALQQGDTLWDISSKFFGNGFYWPKVWQLNDQITNPHMIRVGNTIQFQPGSTTAAPSLAVEQSTNEKNNSDVELSFEDSPEPAPEIEEIPTEQEPTGNTVIIPPPKKRRPVLAKIPSSFPDWRDTTGVYDINGFSMEVFKPIDSHRTHSPVVAIVSESPWNGNGKIVEMEGSSSVAATYQNVIMKMFDPVQKGDLVTVFSNNGKVTSPVDRETIGTEVETRAVIRVDEAIEGTTDTYRGQIVYADLPVRMGDLIKKGDLIKRADFDLYGTPSKVSAKIINGEMGERSVFGLHGIVFLNRGDLDGLQIGSLLPVLKNVRLRNSQTIVSFDPKPIGLLKVVATDGHVSTAVVVSEKDAIVPGDETAVPADNEIHSEESVLYQPPPPGGSSAGPVGVSDAQRPTNESPPNPPTQ